MVDRLSKAQVTLPSDHEVKVTRQFAAPRALVYEAYDTVAGPTMAPRAAGLDYAGMQDGRAGWRKIPLALA
jgi:hypothetical protein